MDIYAKNAPSVSVGVRLRQLREQRNMSMRTLASLSGLSANALSMIERSKTSPSVSTLYKIADALGVSITSFFGDEAERQQVVFIKGNERSRVPFVQGVWEGLGGEQFIGRIEPFVLTLESGATSGQHAMMHTGHEFVFCLRGSLEYKVEDQTYALESGDSLLFAARLRHSWKNAGNVVTNALVLLCDFSEGEHLTGMHLNKTQKNT